MYIHYYSKTRNNSAQNFDLCTIFLDFSPRMLYNRNMLLYLLIWCIVLTLCVIALAATAWILYYKNRMELNIPALRAGMALLADFKVITKINQLSADLYGVPVGDCVPTVTGQPKTENAQDEPEPLPRIKPVRHGGV